MILKSLRNFDSVPENEESPGQEVWTAQWINFEGFKYMEEGSVVTRTREECVSFFGVNSHQVMRVFIPATIPLFWREASVGTYSEVIGIPNKLLKVRE